jgi:predicted transposase YbfD/YdcC
LLLLTQWTVSKIANEILNGNGDYLLAVKGNQKHLEQEFDNIFDLIDLQNEKKNTYVIQEQLHGRSETRLHKLNHNCDDFGDFAFSWQDIITLDYVNSFRKIVLRIAHKLWCDII